VTESIVVDTDVLSFVAKSDTRAKLYESDLAGRSLCVCFQTVAELRLWALIRRWGQRRRAQLDALLQRFVVLRYDAQMAQHWAEVAEHRRRLGRPIECGDAWIAASALRYDTTLLTHNAKDYSDIPNLRIVSHAS
jgi:predicted nucleic acid-binding protein